MIQTGMKSNNDDGAGIVMTLEGKRSSKLETTIRRMGKKSISSRRRRRNLDRRKIGQQHFMVFVEEPSVF